MGNNLLEEILNCDTDAIGCVIWYHMFTNNQDIIDKALQGASEQQIKYLCDTVSRRIARHIIDNVQEYISASSEEIAAARRELLIEITGLQYGKTTKYM